MVYSPNSLRYVRIKSLTKLISFDMQSVPVRLAPSERVSGLENFTDPLYQPRLSSIMKTLCVAGSGGNVTAYSRDLSCGCTGSILRGGFHRASSSVIRLGMGVQF